jgi:hypothetical protein
LVKFLHPSNADCPSVSTEFGIVTSESVSQEINALTPILLTVFGMALFDVPLTNTPVDFSTIQLFSE